MDPNMKKLSHLNPLQNLSHLNIDLHGNFIEVMEKLQKLNNLIQKMIRF